jgi:hypothetical protein
MLGGYQRGSSGSLARDSPAVGLGAVFGFAAGDTCFTANVFAGPAQLAGCTDLPGVATLPRSGICASRRGASDTANCDQVVDAFERAARFPHLQNLAGGPGSEAGDRLQLLRARGIEVDRLERQLLRVRRGRAREGERGA